MGGLNVKNTMVERALQIVAPHPCFGCGKVGSVLCLHCKYDIAHEPFLGCILCGAVCSAGICWQHDSPIDRAFTVGVRGGALEEAINGLKFGRVKAAAKGLAELAHDSLPYFPGDFVIVPVPTVRSHVRQRGYDQVGLFARQFAVLRGHAVERILTRVTNATQHTVNKSTRLLQAETAFRIVGGVDVRGKRILLIDDIVTTGATLEAAAKLLRNAGATVWVITLAYQPLD